MSDTTLPQPQPASDIQNPAPPIPGAEAPRVPEPHVPQVNIPHMGTSRANVPSQETAAQPQAQLQTQAQETAQHTPPALPPLPQGVSEEAVAAAIRQVETTGTAEGIAPEVLAAACQRIEALAASQGIDLHQGGAVGPTAGPGNYVEAAVMDKNATFERFAEQRDSLKEAVAEQRDKAQQPYRDAVQGAGGGTHGECDARTVQALAAALKELDPQTIALINAMGVLTNAPGVLKSIIWLEVIRAMRNLISTEAKHQVEARLKPDVA